MAYGECQNASPDCPWYDRPPKLDGIENGCHTDEDHLIPQRLGETALQNLFLNLPEYRVQRCRQEHDERNARHDAGDLSDVPPFPDVDEMRMRIDRALMEDTIQISKSKARKIFGNTWK